MGCHVGNEIWKTKPTESADDLGTATLQPLISNPSSDSFHGLLTFKNIYDCSGFIRLSESGGRESFGGSLCRLFFE